MFKKEKWRSQEIWGPAGENSSAIDPRRLTAKSGMQERGGPQVPSPFETSERTQLEREILDGEKMFRHLADFTPIMMWMSGKDKLCTYFNRSWLEFTGRPISTDVGTGWAESVYPEDLDRCMQTYLQAFDRREDFKMEYRLRRHDGVYRWIFDNGTPLYSPDGVFEGYIGSCADINESKEIESERIKMREQIAHLNRAASMGQLAASLAHELAQPLAAILSNAQAAARYASSPSPDMEEIRAALAEIAEDDRRARAFMQTMRSMFYKHELPIVRLDLNQCVDELSRIIRVDSARKGIDARLHLSSEPVFVFANSVAVQQIILNLTNNGMDALQQRSPGERLLEVYVRARPAQNAGSVFVKDNGPGIAQDHLEKIFSPFFTTKENELGLGLSICRSLAESIGGRIQLVEQTGPGAEFRLDLPIVEPKPTSRNA